MSKRKRDPVFTIEEKKTLLKLVERYYPIVESKKIDANSMKKKNEEWLNIASEFNDVCGIYPREWTVLKNCWENLKKRAKQEHILGTGGPSKKVIDDPITAKVLELIEGRISLFVNCSESDRTFDSASDSKSQESAENYVCKSDTKINDTIEIIVKREPIDSTSNSDWPEFTENKPQDTKPGSTKSPSNTPDVQEVVESSRSRTPARFTSASNTGRRRPYYVRRREVDPLSINNERVKTFLKAKTHVDEEHEIKMKILHLQEQKEMEILAQEKFKTKQEEIKLRMLEIQLNKLND